MANPWISYIDRSYQQIKASVLSRVKVEVPEMTDHTEGNIFVKLIGIFAGMAEMLGYYIDNHAREAYLSTCRLYASAVRIADTFDYRVKANRAATVDVVFTLSGAAPSNVTIPQGTELSTATGIVFLTLEAGTILTGNTAVTIPCKQVTTTVSNSLIGTSNGAAYQKFDLPSTITDGSVTITISAVAWEGKETLGYSTYEEQHFVQSVNEDRIPYVYFGDDLTGAIPATSISIYAGYQTCVGAAGNTAADTITSIDSAITLPVGFTISCTNPNAASGGANIETLEELKFRIPKATRTLSRAVTRQDFIDIAELVPSVARAAVEYDCTKTANVFVVPVGGGIASTGLLGDVEDYFNDNDIKIIGVQVAAKAAGELGIVLELDLKVLPNYSNSTTSSNVKDNLVAFLSYLNQFVADTLALSDLYEVIENTDGVKNSNITSIKCRPYARPSDTTTTPLNWDRITVGASETSKWDIIFTGSTTFQLLKDNTFVGTYSTGATVSLKDIEFEITAAGYVSGDAYSFYIYEVNTSIELAEYSIAVSNISDITINATGGL